MWRYLNLKLRDIIIPDSGVIPGTYGGPNKIPKITVSKKGLITMAEEIPLGQINE